MEGWCGYSFLYNMMIVFFCHISFLSHPTFSFFRSKTGGGSSRRRCKGGAEERRARGEAVGRRWRCRQLHALKGKRGQVSLRFDHITFALS